MNDKKLLFLFDLDGTLIGRDKMIKDSTLQLIQELKKKGNYISIATGRALFECGSVINNIQPNLPTICANGSVIYDSKIKESIYYREIPKDIIDNLRREFTNYYILEEFPDFIYAEDQKISLIYSMAFNVKRDKVKRIKTTNAASRLYLRSKDLNQSVTEKTINNLKKIICKKVHIDVLGGKWIVLSNTDVDKFSSLKILCDVYNFNLENVVAFGDADNDINLLKNVGTSIVMGNAEYHMKEYGDIIAGHVDDIGVNSVLLDYLSL